AEPLDDGALAAARAADYVTFTSSSTVRFFLEAAGGEAGLSGGTRIVSIGPVTSAALREHGLEPHLEADRHDIDGVIAAPMAVALRAADGDRCFVGPDNGLLWLAAERFGGAVEAVDIGRSPWRLEPVSATFHGRDIFAPVAARLAAGESLAEAGDPCDPDELE